MSTLPIARLGGRQTGPRELTFGVLLPWVNPANGQTVVARVIHERDQFLQSIPPVDVPLSHGVDPVYGDLWSGVADLAGTPGPPGSRWGQPGRYVYRYAIATDTREIDWVIVPCAREYGAGKMSSVTIDYQEYQWSPSEESWRVPQQVDFVFYEMNLAEFASDVAGAVSRLDYLTDLGVNALTLMPVTNVAAEIDWGYLPIGYFGVDERFGQRRDFQWFVDEAHQRGIAVLVDAVYGHASRALFAYSYLYDRLGYQDNPFMGAFADNLFDTQGRSVNYAHKLVRDYFFAVNQHWIEVYHVDGFQYDCVPNYWDRGPGESLGYANLVHRTHQWVTSQVAAGALQRFASDEGLTLVQCAEYLNDPRAVLNDTYSTSAWQNDTYQAAIEVVGGQPGAVDRLGFALGLQGFPQVVIVDGQQIPKAGLQYIENHDHSRFLTEFGVTQSDEGNNWAFLVGDRDNWFRVQPYLIALLTAKGLPLLWQGQELAENATLPGSGLGRVALLRPVNWDHFYDTPGRELVKLTRKLLRLRRDREQLRRGQHWYYSDPGLYQARGVMIFRRYTPTLDTVTAVNFTGVDQTVEFAFPRAGIWAEELHGTDNQHSLGTPQQIHIPGNYGRVWTLVGLPMRTGPVSPT